MIILDSPLTPVSTNEEIRAWLARLDEKERRHARDPEALEQIQIERRLAEQYLADDVARQAGRS